MKKVDAIIAIPSDRQSDKLNEIKKIGIPIILIDRVIPNLVVDTVRVDNNKGTQEAINHLINLGHKSIGYIDRKIDQSHSLEQKLGYKQALEDHEIPYDASNVVRTEDYDYVSGIVAVKKLVQKNPQLTAIFAYYDITALGALRGLIEMGYRIPEDFSVIGYDGMPFTKVSSPRLTTVNFPVNRIARTTCDLLIKRLDREKENHEAEKDIVIVPELIVRDSTGTPRTS
jgi:LacI family transcriptional regulator